MSIRWMSAVWMKSPYRGERLLLHLALADFANDEGTCFPSVRTLARKARCSEVWARQSLQEMVSDGLLEVLERGGGRGRSNLYRLLAVYENQVTQLPVTESNGVTPVDQRGNSGDVHTTYRNRNEPSIDDHFDSFWKEYPRKVGKGKARQAFVRVMQRRDAPTLHDLLAAVIRYRDSVSDPKYIAHPTSWLNAERWLDEIETPAKAATVQVSPSVGNAIGLGNAYALTGRTLQELQEAVAHYADAERTAALDGYNRTMNRRTGK